jgi:hypothetical protein
MNRSLLRIALILTVSVVSAAISHAQRNGPAQYSFGSDTLRYSEQTIGRVSMQVPGGEMVVKSSHVAGIRIRGVTEGRAEGWYDRLVLRQEGPGSGTQEPATDGLIGQPFALAVTATGRVETQSVPRIPVAVAALTDLSRQFDDFFITLPTKPLDVGVAWADTVVRARGSRPDSASSSRHIRSYRVARDTMVAGARAAVIALRQVVRVESTSPMPGRPLQMRTYLEGEETGTALFVVTSGRLHSRERRGTLSGELTITGGPQPATIPQRYEYTSTLSLQPSPR